MAATISVDLNARIANFETNLKQATGSLQKFGGSFESIQKRSEILSGALKGLIPALAIGSIAEFGKSIIDRADELNDLHTRLGVSVKDLASFKLAAEQSGTSLDAVGTGIARLTRSIGDAEAGNKQIAKALADLGVTARDPKEAFFQLADATERIQDPSKRAALLAQVLGKNYQELVPLLADGSDALRESAKNSETFANAMARLAPDADKFNDNLSTLKINAAGLASTLVANMVRGLAQTAAEVQKLIQGDHGLQALAALIGGLSKAPFDAFIGDTKITATATARIKELNSEIDKLSGIKSRRSLFGLDVADQSKQIGILTNQIAVLEKFGDKIYKPKPTATEKPKDDSIHTDTGTTTTKPTKTDPSVAFLANLQKEAATLGFSKTQIDRYDAAKLHLTGTNAKLAASYIGQIESFNAAQLAGKAANDAFDEADKSENDRIATTETAVKSLREYADEQEFEATLIGKTNSERSTAIRLRALETSGIDTQSASYAALTQRIKDAGDVSRLTSLVSDTQAAKTAEFQSDVDLVTNAFFDGKIGAEQMSEAIDKITSSSDKAAPALDSFAKNAAKNIQNSLADFLFNPFDKGIKGMLASFGQFVQRAVAEAAAADLVSSLFGSGKGGNTNQIVSGIGSLFSGGGGSGIDIGNLFNKFGDFGGQNILGSIASVFGYANGGIAAYGKPVPLPRFAGGGVATSAAIFGEAGPEAAVPLPDGRRIPVKLEGAGGQRVIQNFNISTPNADSFRQSQRQIGRSARLALGSR